MKNVYMCEVGCVCLCVFDLLCRLQYKKVICQSDIGVICMFLLYHVVLLDAKAKGVYCI